MTVALLPSKRTFSHKNGEGRACLSVFHCCDKILMKISFQGGGRSVLADGFNLWSVAVIVFGTVAKQDIITESRAINFMVTMKRVLSNPFPARPQ